MNVLLKWMLVALTRRLSVVLAFLICATFAAADESCTRLADLLKQAEFHYFGEEIENVALETDETCINVIKTGHDNSTAQRSQLADALVVIGGPQAVDLLKALYLRDKNSHSRAKLCIAMASTGRASDVEFLIESLQGPQIGLDWGPIQDAALALCLLRRQTTLQPLRAAAAHSSLHTISGTAIRHAVKCVKGGELKTPQAGGLSVEEEVILTVFRSRIPATESTRRFAEVSTNRVWERSASSWTFRTMRPGEADKLPRISFAVRLSGERQRALVDVGITFGPLDGEGYEYVLHKTADAWTIQAVIPKWIS